MAKQYTERDLGAIVAGEWELVGGMGARVDSGIGVTATRRELPDNIWKLAHDVALPFPFTLAQFRAFCSWHPTFEWEAIESQFTNDDGSLDDAALKELAEHGADAAELVRRFLAGASDEAPAEHQTAQQDAPGGNTSGTVVQPKAKPHRRRTWWEVSSPYILEVMSAGQHGTAKSLYLDLERKAGPDSPFDKGTGDNRGGLFVREIAQPLSMKTVQNEWSRLHELLQKTSL